MILMNNIIYLESLEVYLQISLHAENIIEFMQTEFNENKMLLNKNVLLFSLFFRAQHEFLKGIMNLCNKLNKNANMKNNKE